MPDIYDNINKKLVDGLNQFLEQAIRADFCKELLAIRKRIQLITYVGILRPEIFYSQLLNMPK